MDDFDSFDPNVEARPWKYVVLHHTATLGGNIASIDADHQRRRDQFGNAWLGIGYHFVIGNGQEMEDGLVESTFRWKEQLDGAHARSRRHNRSGVGVCLVGDFENAAPTHRQMASLERLADWLMRRYRIEKGGVVRHLDIASTRSPGRMFPYEEFCQRLNDPMMATSSAP